MLIPDPTIQKIADSLYPAFYELECNVVSAMYDAFDENGASLPVTREMKENFKDVDFNRWEENKAPPTPQK